MSLATLLRTTPIPVSPNAENVTMVTSSLRAAPAVGCGAGRSVPSHSATCTGGDPGGLGGQDPPQIRSQLFWGVLGGPPWGVRGGSTLEAGVVFTGRGMASYIPIMICKSVCQRGSLKRFSVVKNRPLARLPWSSTEVTLTSSRSLPFANTVPAVLVRKSSEVQVSLCMTLECYRNNRISYCVIALILKMRGAFLASDSAPVAGDGAF